MYLVQLLSWVGLVGQKAIRVMPLNITHRKAVLSNEYQPWGKWCHFHVTLKLSPQPDLIPGEALVAPVPSGEQQGAPVAPGQGEAIPVPSSWCSPGLPPGSSMHGHRKQEDLMWGIYTQFLHQCVTVLAGNVRHSDNHTESWWTVLVLQYKCVYFHTRIYTIFTITYVI